ncbi:serine/threonine-protein kinase ATG1b-like [Elaeis guineensis]|uniref:serine/threonine-protein kinase ATG1b-like n=1 Tax=Elaeis guineensis var. tenera TaxID=51953 RepID=UPI0009501365
MARPSSMVGGGGGGQLVGNYMISWWIRLGVFLEVWLGRHWVWGTEVAIMGIVMQHMDKKLQDSLLSNVFFLQKINCPNIITLHDFIQGCFYLSSNTCYQIINGLECVVEASPLARYIPPVAMAFTSIFGRPASNLEFHDQSQY